MKKWAVWKTIVIVIASIFFVGGITVLGIYLAGGFSNKVVNPDSLSFMLDENLYNPETNQFEVTSEFQLTINGTNSRNETITNTQLTLSLNNGHDIDNNKIDNGVIIVPKYVNVNQPFDVILNRSVLQDEDGGFIKDEYGNIVLNWITGGIATITATTQDQSFPVSTSARIAVDTPVLKISTKTVDFNGRELESVTLNENFTLKTTFFPANSEYLFNDQANDAIAEKRTRKVFFESMTNAITQSYDETIERYFTAQSLGEENKIMAYTFESARNQIDRYNQILNENNQDRQITYSLVLSHLRTVSAEAKRFELNVPIVPASIKSFEVDTSVSPMEMTIGQGFTITMQPTQFANSYLGARVISTNDEVLLSMLKNVAISFEYYDGQKYVDAIANGMLKVACGDKVDYQDKNGRNFYFADSSAPNTQFAFWRLSRDIKEDQNFVMTVVLFVEVEDDKFEIFQDDGVDIEYYINLSAEVHEDEPIDWVDGISNTMNIILNYNGSQTNPETRPLGGLTDVPEGNVYKTVKFFASFQGLSEVEVQAILGGSVRKQTYTFGTQLLELYEVPNELTVRDVGEFDLYFATIETDSEGHEIILDGKYVIAQAVANPIKVVVTKTLHENSITDLTSSTNAEPAQEGENIYYFNSGANSFPATQDTITLTFKVAEDSWGIFKEKLEANRIQINLYDLSDNLMNNSYFNIQTPTFDDAEHTVSYVLKIKDTFNVDANDVRLAKASLFDLDNTSLDMGRFEIRGASYYLYTPKPDSIVFANKEETTNKVDFTQTVIVEQSLSNSGSQLLISYVDIHGTTRTCDSVEEFTNLLAVTVTDQHGKTDIFANSWTFTASNDDAIIIVGQSFSFPTTQGQKETNLSVRTNLSSANITAQEFLKLQVVSTGIQKIKKDNSPDVLENPVAPTLVEQEALGSIEISKFGASYAQQDSTNPNAGEINFYNMIALYLGVNEDGSADEATQYSTTQYKFNFASQYLYSLSDTKIAELFGEDGMIALVEKTSTGALATWQAPSRSSFANDTAYATELRTRLGGIKVAALSFRYNFYIGGERLLFNILDEGNTGAVRISLTFTILQNITHSSSAENIGANKDVYARVDKSIENTNNEVVINYANGTTGLAKTKNISELLKEFDGYYIVDIGENGYKIAYFTNEQLSNPMISASIVGRISNGAFNFNDFWEDESKTFNVNFYYEGTENSFAPYYTFTIDVQRNIQVTQSDRAYTFTQNSGESSLANINSYITVSRIVALSGADQELPTITYAIDTNNYIDIVNNAGGQPVFSRKSAIPVFTYNKTSFNYNVSVYIAGVEDPLALKTIEFKSGVNYQDIAQRLTSGDINAEVQNIGEVNYLKLTTGAWTLDNVINVENPYSYSDYYYMVTALYNDTSSNQPITYQSQTRFYNVSTISSVTHNQSIVFDGRGSQGLFGVDNNKEFMVLRVLNSSDSSLQAVMIVPVVVSRIGSLYGIYDLGEDTTVATIDDLLNCDAKALIDEGKFKKVKAGEKFVIASSYDTDTQSIADKLAQLYYFNTTVNPVSIRIEEIKNSYSRDGLLNRIIYEDPNDSSYVKGDVMLELNHLVGDLDEFAYITLRATLMGNGFTQVFYYIVRVEPNAKVEKVVYPYNDTAEYINIAKNEDGTYKTFPVYLDEKHNATTINPDKNRFNITVNNVKNPILPVIDTIKSVNDGVYTYENPSDWEEIVDISFNPATSSTGARTMYITPKTDRTLTIVLTRNWQNVVGGVSDYTFIVNDASLNYVLEFPSLNNGITQDSAGVYKWTIDRKTFAEEQNSATTVINLRDRRGGASTLVYNLLSINPQGRVDDKRCSISYNNTPSIVDGLDANTLRVTLDEYLDQQYKVSVYLYSEFGLLGTLEITIEGSVSWQQVEAKKEVPSGSIQAVKDLFEVKAINNDKENLEEKYNIKDVQILTSDCNYADIIKFLDSSNNSLLKADLRTASNIEDKTIRLRVVLNMLEMDKINGEYQTFTFEFDVKLTKSLTNINDRDLTSDPADAQTISHANEVVAGDNVNLNVSGLFKGGITNATALYTWTAVNGGNAFDEGSITSAEMIEGNIQISTKEVSVPVNCIARIRVDLSFAGEKYCTFYVQYAFTVTPNVVVHTNAPAPQGRELDVEYIKDGAEFGKIFDEIDNIEFGTVFDNFINAQAPFVGREDVIDVKDGQEIKRSSNYSGDYDFTTTSATISDEGTDYLTRFIVGRKRLLDGTFAQIKDMTLKIVSTQNATIYSEESDGTRNYYSSDDVNNTIYRAGSVNVESLVFRIGERQIVNGRPTDEIKSDGNESRVTFQLSCNSVVQTYTIVIVPEEDIYNITLNQVTENTDTQNIETFYVDKLTKSTEIFAEARLAKVAIQAQSKNSNISTLLESEYQMLFEQKTATGYSYKNFKDIKFAKNMIGQTFNIDLGESLVGYTFVGLYSNDETILSIGDNGIPSTDYNTPFKPNNTNYADDIFDKPIELISRVQLTYNGLAVDFNKYASDLTFISNSGADTNVFDYQIEQTENDLDKVFKVTGFNFKGNMIDVEYQYLITVDIEVKQALEIFDVKDEKGNVLKDEKGNTIKKVTETVNNIEVYNEQNLIRTMKVYHPSTSDELLFKDSDLMNDNVSLDLQVVGLGGIKVPEGSDWEKAIKETFTEIPKPYKGNNDLYRYLAISAIQKKQDGTIVGEDEQATEKLYTTDYYIRGLGAENKGNKVLLHLVYSVTLPIPSENDPTTYVKDFYIMMKVLPDYRITYLKAGEVEPDENGIVSNQGENTIYTLSEASGETYNETNLAGIDSRNLTPIVSVQHKNDRESLEVGGQSFTYTMTLDDEQDALMYNSTLNVEKKLAYGTGSPLPKPDESKTNWTINKDGEKKVVSYEWKNTSDNAVLSLQGAKVVKFGTQYYRFEAEDAYGYKFVVCFALSNTNLINPELSFNSYLTEGASFDIGAQYYKLSLSDRTVSTDSGNYIYLDTAGDDEPKTSSFDGETLNIINLDKDGVKGARGYDQPLWEEDGLKQDYVKYFNQPARCYTNELKSSIEQNGTSYTLQLGDPSKGYFANKAISDKLPYTPYDIPTFMNLRVLKIDFIYDGKVLPNTSIVDRSDIMATNNELYLYKEVKGMYQSATGRYTMPALPGWIYENNDEVQIEIAITLGYGNDLYKGSQIIEEQYELHAPIAVKKSTEFSSELNNVVQDGRQFNVKDYIRVTQNENNTIVRVNNYDIYDDTLAVYLQPNDSISFNIRAFKTREVTTESGETTENIIQDSLLTREEYTIQNGRNYAYIEYLSLSEALGRTLEKDYKFVIDVISAEVVDGNKPTAVFKYGDKTSVYKSGATEKTNDQFWVGNQLVNGTAGTLEDNEATKIQTLSNNGTGEYFDTINVENSLRLNSNYANIPQYYLISIPARDKDGNLVRDENNNVISTEYRYTQTYTVTGYYYSMNYNYDGPEKHVDEYIKYKEGNEDRYIIPFASWTKGMSLNRAVRNNSGLTTATGTFDSFSKMALKTLDFQITARGNSGGASGAATINSQGDIVTGRGFNLSSHYISVVIRQKVSGFDGRSWAANPTPTNDFNLTSRRSLSLRLVDKNEDGKDLEFVDLKDLSGVISGNTLTTGDTLTTSHRVYFEDEIVYEERTITLLDNMTDAQVTVSPTTLWKNERVDKNGNDVIINGINFGDKLVTTNPPYTFKIGAPMYKVAMRNTGTTVNGNLIIEASNNQVTIADGTTYIQYTGATTEFKYYYVVLPRDTTASEEGKYTIGNPTLYELILQQTETTLQEDIVVNSNVIKKSFNYGVVVPKKEEESKGNEQKHVDVYEYKPSGSTISYYLIAEHDSEFKNDVDAFVEVPDSNAYILQQDYDNVCPNGMASDLGQVGEEGKKYNIMLYNGKKTTENGIVDAVYVFLIKNGRAYTILSNFAILMG